MVMTLIMFVAPILLFFLKLNCYSDIDNEASPFAGLALLYKRDF